MIEVGQIYQSRNVPAARLRIEWAGADTIGCVIINEDGSDRRNGRGGIARVGYSTRTLEKRFKLATDA